MIFFRIVSAFLVLFVIASCAPVQTKKEEAKEVLQPQPEEIKLPELPKKPAETKETKKVEPLRVEQDAKEKFVILNFDGADIETVISTIGELLNINYILGAGVTGKVTIQSYRKFPVRELFPIFQTILEVNGLTAVKDGAFYRIVPIDTAKQQPVSVQAGKELKLQLDSSFITQIVPLEYVRANDIVNVLRNLMPRGTDLVVYEPTNLLIITAPPAGLIKFMKVLEALDVPATDRESVRTFVYYVENGEAKKLAEILKSLYAEKKDSKAKAMPSLPPVPKSMAPTTSVIEGFPGEVEGDVVITAYEDVNGLLIKANPRSYLAILEILKKLDVPVKQVLIEVLIAEVTLDDTTKFGLEWLLKAPLHAEGQKMSTLSGFNPSGYIASGVGSSLASIPTASPFASVIKPERLGLVMSALSKLEDVNVLASPHILAMDNKEANIQIGSEEPIATGYTAQPISTTGSQITQATTGQIQYKTVGTLLTVKPHITEKNRVTLEITQEVSSVGVEPGIGGSPRFSTRKAKTTAVVQDGHTLVLGGLITESKKQGRSGIPFLSKIPILGYLFGTTTDTYNKTELLVMVTPHVISNQDEADVITKDFQNRVKTVKKNIEKAKLEKTSVSKNIAVVEVEKDSSLMDIVESKGYTLRDEDVNDFLNEFIALNEGVKSIKLIPKGSVVKLPLSHLNKTKNEGR